MQRSTVTAVRPRRNPAGIVVLLGLSVLVLAGGCATTKTSGDRRVLVLNFENTLDSMDEEGWGRTLNEMLTAELSNHPNIAIVQSRDLSASGRDWLDEGRRAKIDYVINGSISQIDDVYFLSARILSTHTGEIVPGSAITRPCRQKNDIYPVMKYIGYVLAHHLNVLNERYHSAGV